MENADQKHWWWLGRQRILETLLLKVSTPQNMWEILDFGAGTGANTPMLQRFGNVTALDMDKGCVKLIKDKYGIEAVLWKYPDKLDKKFDLILLADVLEHLEDDRGAANWIHAHLKDGGLALVSVPAHRYLWTQMDDIAEHFRRYEKNELLSVLSQFTPVKITYYNFFLFPVKVIFTLAVNFMRKFSLNDKSRTYNDVAISDKMSIPNEIMKQVLYLEAKIISYVSLPYGVSLVALVRKK